MKRETIEYKTCEMIMCDIIHKTTKKQCVHAIYSTFADVAKVPKYNLLYRDCQVANS